MAGTLNKCLFIGNLTRDPEIRQLGNNDAVTRFSIGVNRRARGDKTITTYVPFAAWNSENRKLAETIHALLKKGMTVFVEGELRTYQYDHRDGTKRDAFEYTVREFQILDKKSPTNGSAHSEEGDLVPVGAAYGAAPDEPPSEVNEEPPY
jgi:single-strand DNA-binding protein